MGQPVWRQHHVTIVGQSTLVQTSAAVTFTGKTHGTVKAMHATETLAALSFAGKNHTLTYTSGAFDPSSIAGLVGWFDFADISTLWKDTARSSAVTADGDRIKGVTDKSGSGFHLSQAGTGATYKTAIQNGKSIARFSAAATEFLEHPTTPVASQPTTVFAVAKPTASAALKTIFGADSVTAAHDAALLVAATTGFYEIYAGSILAGAVDVTGGWHVFTSLFNGASSSQRKDGSGSVGNAGTGDYTGYNVGGRSDDSSKMLGDIGEVLVYTGDKTANFATIEAGLKTKWGTP
jgi:hypothetical protein